jgi:hypothetical protein
MLRPGSLVLVGMLFLAAQPVIGQARDSARSTVARATISGVVNDEYAEPLAKAEVVVQPGNYSAVTDDQGKFRIQAPVGEYNVVFRHLGYGPEDFSWRARAGEGTELSIKLNPLPQALDTVVILDTHNRAAGKSTISGVAFDKSMKPLSDVEIQLLGTGKHATSYEKGEFFFAGLAQGNYVIRARRLGYRPTSIPITIGKGEAHDLSLILARLPNTLATVEVREKSGYGNSGQAWEEFDKRQRWKSTNNFTIGRDVLGSMGKTPMDVALRGTQAQSLLNQQAGGYAPTSINPGNHSALALTALTQIPGDVCVLLNGEKPMRVPLSFFRANEVEWIEIYAPNSDYSNTIGSHMEGTSGCERVGFTHPTYYVVWMRSTV